MPRPTTVSINDCPAYLQYLSGEPDEAGIVKRWAGFEKFTRNHSNMPLLPLYDASHVAVAQGAHRPELRNSYAFYSVQGPLLVALTSWSSHLFGAQNYTEST